VTGAVQVIEVDANTPAAQIGLQKGDIIVQLNGKPVDSIDTLHQLLNESSINKKLPIWVVRGGTQLMQLEITPRGL
jgi:S1-C subfamily serine protease